MFSMYDLTSFADRLEELQGRVSELEALRARVDALERQLAEARGNRIDWDQLTPPTWMQRPLNFTRVRVEYGPTLVRGGSLPPSPWADPTPPPPAAAPVDDLFARAWRDYSGPATQE